MLLYTDIMPESLRFTIEEIDRRRTRKAEQGAAHGTMP